MTDKEALNTFVDELVKHRTFTVESEKVRGGRTHLMLRLRGTEHRLIVTLEAANPVRRYERVPKSH